MTSGQPALMARYRTLLRGAAGQDRTSCHPRTLTPPRFYTFIAGNGGRIFTNEGRCIACRAGSYSAATGQPRECASCPVTEFSAAESTKCTACPPGAWRSASNGAKCVSCPKGSLYLNTQASGNAGPRVSAQNLSGLKSLRAGGWRSSGCSSPLLRQGQPEDGHRPALDLVLPRPGRQAFVLQYCDQLRRAWLIQMLRSPSHHPLARSVGLTWPFETDAPLSDPSTVLPHRRTTLPPAATDQMTSRRVCAAPRPTIRCVSRALEGAGPACTL